MTIFEGSKLPIYNFAVVGYMGSTPDGFLCDCRPDPIRSSVYVFLPICHIYIQGKCVNALLACSGFIVSILVFIAI